MNFICKYNEYEMKCVVMHQRQQNTLYPKGGNENKFLEASDWFTAYSRGMVFNSNIT